MAARLLNRIRFRFYQDVLMPSRLNEYERILRKFLSFGYQFLTVRDLARRVSDGTELDAKTVILRHDVDSDSATAGAMFRIEESLGIASSYFFRLCTLDFSLMRKIEESKGEASYHFEEIAIIAKAKGLRSRQEVIPFLPAVRDMFQANVLRLRQESGLSITTVASHGDFVNRIIGMANHEFLDASLRQQLGILAEVYDPLLAKPVTIRVADRPPPVYWYPNNPLESAADTAAVIYILIHPKQWYARTSANLSELARRVGDGVIYKWRSHWRVKGGSE